MEVVRREVPLTGETFELGCVAPSWWGLDNCELKMVFEIDDDGGVEAMLRAPIRS